MTLLVKLGSSIVAADDGELRVDVLDSVCEQVAALEQGGERVVLVTSGAIARGIRMLELPARPRAMDELQAASAVGQGDLFRAYEERLSRNGTHAAQVLLTAADIAARTNYLNARQTLRRLIEWGVVPVVNENDTTATDEISFGDNDFLAAQVAILLDARLLVLLSNVEGLHSADPSADPDAARVDEVGDFSELGEMEIGDRTSAFGSGGMRSKVAAAKMASEAGIPSVICDGTRPGSLARRGGRRGGRNPVRRPGGEVVELQALAQICEAGAGEADGRRGRGAGSARERLEPAAGRDHGGRGRVRGRRRGRGRDRRIGPRQGDRRVLGARAGPGPRVEERRGPRAAAARGRRGDPPGSLRAHL